MSTVRVIAGSLKGRMIPFSRKRFKEAEITPQKVKGALFSILGDLEGTVFLDLYSCSGQIGTEALSRGAGLVIMNEVDAGKFSSIRDFVESLDRSNVMLLNLHAVAALKHLKKNGITTDHIFLDPPYPERGREAFYRDIIREIEDTGCLADGGYVVVQHDSGALLNGEVGPFTMTQTRKYGSNTLTIYRSSVI